MSSYNMKRGSNYRGNGRGKGRANQTEYFRPWNAAALGKPISEPTYDPGSVSSVTYYETIDTFYEPIDTYYEPMDIDEYQIFEIDYPQFRPWNAACLNKINVINNGSSGITPKHDKQSNLFPEQLNQDNCLYQHQTHYSSYNEDLKQINWDDFTKQMMLEEARSIRLQNLNQNSSTIDKTILEEFDPLHFKKNDPY